MPDNEDIAALEARERSSRKLAVSSADMSVRIVQTKMADQYAQRILIAQARRAT